MLILGIETSCDETAAAVIRKDKGKTEVLSSVISSQIELHAQWGGVVPNLAAREHLKNILPVIESSLKEAKIRPQDLDLIAVTQGPGLIPALLVGTNAAKTLSYVWDKPLIGIHHIEGHIYANFIFDKIRSISKQAKIKFPILCLVVSGGHTQLVLMKKHLDYEIIGETLDDAAGEAFDKVARILGKGYPGGPIISQMAKNFKQKKEAVEIKLPRPMIKSKDFNFSFSGLKTAVLYLVKNNPEKFKDEKFLEEAAYEFQQAAIDVLVGKTLKAIRKYNPQTVMMAGGVSVNQELRAQMEMAVKKDFPSVNFHLPEIKYTLDNAAMIAAAAAFRWENSEDKERFFSGWKNLEADANLKI